MNIALFGLTIDKEGAVRAMRDVSEKSAQMAKEGAKSAQLYADAFQEKLNRVARQYIPETMRAIDALAERQKALAAVPMPQMISDAELARSSRAYDEMIAKMDGVEKASVGAGVGLGRVRQGMTSLVASMTGTSPIVGRLATTLGAFAAGSGLMVAVLAGIAAIGYAYDKITESARKAADQVAATAKEFSRIAHMSVVGQGEAAQTLYAGDPFAEKAIDRQSVPALRQQIADLQRRSRETTLQGGPGGVPMRVLSDGAKDAAEQMKVLNTELARRNVLLASITGPGGSIGRAGTAQAAADLPGFVTDQINQRAREGKGDEAAAKRLAKEQARQAERDAADAQRIADHQANARNKLAINEIKHRAAERLKAEHDAAKAQARALDQGAWQIGDDVVAGLKREADEKKYQDRMHREWTRGIQRMLANGLTSWRSFFGEVLGMFQRLMSEMERAGKTSGGGYKALGIGASAISGGLAGFSIGQQMYSPSHGGSGNTARGALGGAVAGAAIGGEIAGPYGAAAGAIVGLIAGIIGVGSAAKAAAKQMTEAVAAVKLSMDALRATVHGDALGAAIASVEADRVQRAKAIEDAWSGGGAGSDRVIWRTQQLKDLNALEDERIRQLKEEYALSRQRAYEDLQVRDLASQGREKEARALALQLAQQREMEQYIKDKADPATIALLAQVQAQEKLKSATDAATSSALNMVQGYNIQARIFAESGRNFTASGTTTGGGTGFTSFTPMPSSPHPTSTDPGVMQPIVLELDGEVVARAVKRVFKAASRRTGSGDDSVWEPV